MVAINHQNMEYIGGLLLPTNIGLENPHFEWLKFLQMSRIGRPALGTTHSTLL